MALRNYSLLKGKVIDLALDDDDSPHIELLIEANGTKYRAAINVRSKLSPHDLLFLRKKNYDNHQLTQELATAPVGLSDIRNDIPQLAIDYVHGGLFTKQEMKIAPYSAIGDNNDLKDFILPIAELAKNSDDIDVCVLGESWGPEPNKRDKYFDFLPGNGIHDVHMNQGSRGSFSQTNGPKQDGGLFFHIKPENRWVAIFLAFQSQDWNTNPDTGQPKGIGPVPDEPIVVDPLLPSVSIVAALINAVGNEEGNETVTLINRSDVSVSLDGWSLQDKQGRSLILDGVLKAGATVRVVLPAGMGMPRLSNKGGEIRLVSADGSVAHRILYKKKDVTREGWTSVF